MQSEGAVPSGCIPKQLVSFAASSSVGRTSGLPVEQHAPKASLRCARGTANRQATGLPHIATNHLVMHPCPVILLEIVPHSDSRTVTETTKIDIKP